MNIVQLSIKRTFDIIASLLGMIILSPIYLVIALALKLKGKGSVIFSQERIGLHGQPFTIYKFRTMVEHDENTPQLRAAVPEERSSKLQMFLRKHHLDELPQLWNILRGDMSFVGPRPERQFFIDKISERTADYAIILQMRPGLTSESSLYNGYTDTIDKMLKRLELDIRYYHHRTLRLDLSIIIDTII